MPRTIDWHTHRYPEEVFADPAGWANARGEAHWAALVTQGPQGWADRAAMLAAMDAAGIDAAVLQGWYWEHQETCDWHNAWHLRWAQEDPARFIPFATVQPAAGRRAVEAVRAALDAGCRGIGELMPTAQGFALDDPTFAAICTLACERAVPLTLHVTEPVGHAYPGRVETPLEGYVALAERFPSLRLVLAHWGGGLPFYTLNRRVAQALAQVRFDTAASSLLYGPGVWRAVADRIGPGRILFGTDYPLRLKPRQPGPPQMRSLVEECQAAGFSAADTAAILGGNAGEWL